MESVTKHLSLKKYSLYILLTKHPLYFTVVNKNISLGFKQQDDELLAKLLDMETRIRR